MHTVGFIYYKLGRALPTDLKGKIHYLEQA